MSGKRGGAPEPVSGLIEGLLSARGLTEGIERASVIPDWPEIVGPQIASVSTPVGFDRATLFVEVRSSAWLMELRMMERRLLAKLNAGRRKGKFTRIIFRLAEGGRDSVTMQQEER